MGKLEQIGFYTLSDKRARTASVHSPLQRAELILTHRCNFKCGYCRGLRKDITGDLPFQDALRTLDIWTSESLKNIRFSGGEPTLYPFLGNLVQTCRRKGVERIAVSTNGSQPLDTYRTLVTAGVNDFSISLDACCAATGDSMAGGIRGSWKRVTDNIREISKLAYTTVGVVVDERNVDETLEVITLAHSLGVHDIRIIPSAQYNRLLEVAARVPAEILSAHPILAYRVRNIRSTKPVRGIGLSDTRRCWLALDDMAVAGKYHFPCIIYMREQGDPIGKLTSNVRIDREIWSRKHNAKTDPICSRNCLDVCVDYNNRVQHYASQRVLNTTTRSVCV